MSASVEIALAFKAAMNIPRGHLYGTHADRQVPKSLADASTTPYLGFVGAYFERGGTLLIASNPGGGGDEQEKTPGDAALERCIFALRDASPDQAVTKLNEMTRAYVEQLKIINLRRIVTPVLAACKRSMAQVAFLNLFPYRTKNNVSPSASAFRIAAVDVVAPLVKTLAPSRIIFLGLRAGRMGFGLFDAEKKYIVERTIGDSRVCDEAKKVLSQIEGQSA